MRKVRDYDAELKALGYKARALKLSSPFWCDSIVSFGDAVVCGLI